MVDLIRPSNLPAAPSVGTNAAIAIDTGAEVLKATPKQITDAGRPVASESEAVSGVSNSVAMTPLRVKQAFDVNAPAIMGQYVDLARAWAESASPPDPMDPNSKSSKTSAIEAGLSAAQAALYDGPWRDDVSALLADTTLTYSSGSPSSIAAGDYVRTRAEGFSYRVMPQGAALGPSGYQIATAGGVLLAVLSKDILAFGAIGDGITDNAVAFAAWEAAGRGEMNIPAGSFLTSGVIFIDMELSPNVSIRGDVEAASEIIYTGTGKFIRARRESPAGALGPLVGIVVENLTFRTTRPGLASALNIELSDDSASTGSFEALSRRVSNVRFIGLGANAYWADGVVWENTTFGLTENIMFRGLNGGGNAMVFSGDRDAVDNYVTNIRCVDADRIIKVTSDKLEGLYVEGMVGVSINCAVDWATAGGPALVVSKGHVNIKANGTAFVTRSVDAATFSDLTVYLAEGATAFDFDHTLPFSATPRFANVNVFGVGTPAQTGRTGLKIGAGMSRFMVDGIAFFDLATGITIANGARNITILPGVGFYNVTNNIVDNTTNAPSDRNRIWSQQGNNQRLSLPDDAGVRFILENLSRGANQTKFVGYQAVGRATTGQEKAGGEVRFTPRNNDWAHVDVDFYGRSSEIYKSLMTLRHTGAPIFRPPAAAQTLDANGDVTFEMTNNTTLTFRARGSDGVTRTGTITLS